MSELREIIITRNYTQYAEGSVLIEFGKTKVLCNASVLETVPFHRYESGGGWVTAEYSMLPRATHMRSEREAVRGAQNGRTQEIQRLIGRSLRSVFDLSKLGPRTLHLDCDVVQADGGTRTAAITGAYVAAYDAINYLLRREVISENPILDQVAAISVGMYRGQAVLDLDYAEDSDCDTDMNVVMTGTGHLVEIQATAEKNPFSYQDMTALIELANHGIQFLLQQQCCALKDIK